MDWRFPGYFDPEGLPENAALMKKQCYDQVEELVTRYGKPDILWYDGGWLAHKGSDTSSAWFWEPGKLNAMVRSHSPETVINPRSGWEGDFYCDEGSHEIQGKIIPVPWEKNMCLCSGSSWGWMADDPVSDFDWLIKMLVNVVCRDGNLLLNIGPDRNGKVSEEIHQRIRQIGDWLSRCGESIYNTRGGPFEPEDEVYGTTFRENRIYLHILDTAAFAGRRLPDPGVRIRRCYLLGTEEDTPFEQGEEGLRITLPQGRKTTPQDPDCIVVLELDGKVPQKEENEVYFTGKE